MIDRILLTEALARCDQIASDGHGEGFYVPDVELFVEAARLLLDFPTDQQVEAAARFRIDEENGKGAWDAFEPHAKAHWLAYARRMLEAVRDTMIGGSDD